MDNDGVVKMETKTAKETKIKATPAQDTKEIGTISDGGKIGHEDKFEADKPDVPRAQATIGDEDKSNTVNDKGDMPSVPHGSPLMDGEEHFTPEKGNVVDGNQGAHTQAATKQTTKTAACDCGSGACDCGGGCGSKGCRKACKSCLASTKVACNKGDCDGDSCDCGSGYCGQHCFKCKGASTKQTAKTAGTQNSEELKKESQVVSPKSVEKLEDDPDINQGSGAGQGKTHADQAHSLGVDEKKPSDGMSEPSVPEAPNAGQLNREHTYDANLNGPEIPAGGGMNPEYDQNEKNEPEKLDQTLGKDMGVNASADKAVRIAGQMLKANMISIEPYLPLIPPINQ